MKYVVRTGLADEEKDEDEEVTGSVTYIVKNYSDVFGRFDAEDKDGKEFKLFVADFDGWRIGEDDVSEAVMKAWLAADAGSDKTNADKLDKVDVVTEDGKEILVVEGSGWENTGAAKAEAAAKQITI